MSGESAAKLTFTPRKKDGSVRMANSKGFEYWIAAKDVGPLMALRNDKAWKKVPDPPEGKKHGPTGPPRKV